jgi:tetratricopeptide (TPR) repeat protein
MSVSLVVALSAGGLSFWHETRGNSNVLSLMNNASAASLQGNFSLANSDYAAILKTDPMNLNVVALRAQTEAAMGEYNLAAIEESMIANAAPSYSTFTTLASYEYNNVDPKAAGSAIFKAGVSAGGNWSEVTTAASSATTYGNYPIAQIILMLVPVKSRTWIWYGILSQVEVFTGEPLKVNETMHQVVRLAPANQIASMWLQLGTDWLNSGNAVLALNAFQKATDSAGAIDRSLLLSEEAQADDQVGSWATSVTLYKELLTLPIGLSGRSNTQIAIARDYVKIGDNFNAKKFATLALKSPFVFDRAQAKALIQSLQQ